MGKEEKIKEERLKEIWGFMYYNLKTFEAYSDYNRKLDPKRSVKNSIHVKYSYES